MTDIIAKTREDYNRIAELYALTRTEARELIQFQNFIKPQQKILDWGCGNGRLVYLVQEKKVEYFGTDQSREMIYLAKKQFEKEVKEGWCHFFCTEEKEQFFEDNFFDLVFMIASFHHLPDSESRLKVLQNVYRELKKEGNLIMTNWNLESKWAQEKFKKDWQKIGEYDYLIPWKSKEGVILAERYYHHFTPNEIKELCEKAGFFTKEIYYAKNTEQVDKDEGKNLVFIVQKK